MSNLLPFIKKRHVFPASQPANSPNLLKIRQKRHLTVKRKKVSVSLYHVSRWRLPWSPLGSYRVLYFPSQITWVFSSHKKDIKFSPLKRKLFFCHCSSFVFIIFFFFFLCVCFLCFIFFPARFFTLFHLFALLFTT